ncbi:MAG: hypothetical protein RLY40_338 [Pseudomonadota bacterium]
MCPSDVYLNRKKILIVVTSIAKYPKLKRATGLWLGEAVHFVKKLQDEGYQVDYISPEGGYTPIDPHSLEQATSLDWEWYQDKVFMNRLGATLKPNQIQISDYQVIYFTGGHGVMWDFPDNQELQALTLAIYQNGGIVSAVCHGVVALLNVKLPDGSYLIKGKEITGFSNCEETLAKLDKQVPFLTEDQLMARGGLYKKAPKAWESFAIQEGRLITGQNPASAAQVADLVISQLKKLPNSLPYRV